MAKVWLDGKLVDASTAQVPIVSNAVFRGTTVFDVMAIETVDGVPHGVGLTEHLARFERSMFTMGMESPWSNEDLRAAISAVVATHRDCGIVRLVALWADAVAGLPTDARPMVLVAGEPPPASPPSTVAIETAVAKIPAEVQDPLLKVAAGYAAGVRCEREAIERGFDAIVNVTADRRFLLEGVSSSVAVLEGDRWRLPPLTQVLDSITRRLVVDVVSSAGLTVDVGPVELNEIARADALVMSSTTKPFVPVAQIDDLKLAPNPTISEMGRLVGEVLAGRHGLSERWLTRLTAS